MVFKLQNCAKHMLLYSSAYCAHVYIGTNRSKQAPCSGNFKCFNCGIFSCDVTLYDVLIDDDVIVVQSYSVGMLEKC